MRAPLREHSRVEREAAAPYCICCPEKSPQGYLRLCSRYTILLMRLALHHSAASPKPVLRMTGRPSPDPPYHEIHRTETRIVLAPAVKRHVPEIWTAASRPRDMLRDSSPFSPEIARRDTRRLRS